MGRCLSTTSTMPSSRTLSTKLGMWTFLATEVMFFGGLFAAYTVYRNLHFDGFKAAKPSPELGSGSVQYLRPPHQ